MGSRSCWNIVQRDLARGEADRLRRLARECVLGEEVVAGVEDCGKEVDRRDGADASEADAGEGQGGRDRVRRATALEMLWHLGNGLRCHAQRACLDGRIEDRDQATA